MVASPAGPSLTAGELQQLAELERVAVDEGGIMTPGEAYDLALLRNRRDGRDDVWSPRWEIRQLPNDDYYVVDLDEEMRQEAEMCIGDDERGC